jgi:putative membrane protein
MLRWLRQIGIHFLVNFTALFAAQKWIAGISFASEDWMPIAIAAVGFGLANTFIRPLLAFFSVPFLVLSLGLFGFVLNAVMLKLTAFLVLDFAIVGFLPALKASLLITFTHLFAGWLLRETLRS